MAIDNDNRHVGSTTIRDGHPITVHTIKGPIEALHEMLVQLNEKLDCLYKEFDEFRRASQMGSVFIGPR